MAKRTVATSWNLIGDKNETGAMIDLNYTCPYCHFETGDIIFIGPANVDKIDGGFETDQVCGICDKDVIVECI